MVRCTQHVPRGRKLVTFVRKCFLLILHVFLQNSGPVRILMLYAIFNIFDKMSNFCRVGPAWSNLNNRGQNEQLVKSTNHVQYIFMKCFYKNIIFNNNNFFKSIYIKNNFKKSIYDHKIFFKILKSNMYPIFIF